MKLTIILRPNTGKENSVAGLIQLCSTRANVYATVNESQDEETEERFYELWFNDLKDAKLFIYEWFYSFTLADHDYLDVTRTDIALEAEDQDLINHISNNTHRATVFDVEMLDMIISDVTYDQQAIKNRLTAIEQYIQGSGIIHYQQFMKELVEVLDAREILDRESVLAKMFNTFH